MTKIHFHLIRILVPLLGVSFVVTTIAQTGDATASGAQPIHLLAARPSVVPEYFSPAPAPGVHPRVLISPQDLPKLRQLLSTTDSGKFIQSRLEPMDVFHGNGKGLMEVYNHLVAGDLNALNYTDNTWAKGKVGANLEWECFEALITEDEERGKKAAAALTTLALIGKGMTPLGPDVSLAMGYDFVYPYMTDAQRDIVRKTIASATSGKETYGAVLKPVDRDYNWMPEGMKLVLCALAIEGEPGYDPSIYPKSVQVMKDFLHYGIFPSGAPKEDMHYYHYGMGNGAWAMVAFAKRGDNLFNDPHYRAVPNWLVASVEPFGDAFSTHQDTPPDGNGGVLSDYTVEKWVWPQDPTVNYIWKSKVREGYDGLGGTSLWSNIALFPSDAAGLEQYSGKPFLTKWGIVEDPAVAHHPDPVKGVEDLHLPLSFWSPERGYLMTRDKWDGDALKLDFDMNVSGEGGGHYHANAGNFTVSALGRRWAIDRGFHLCESKDNSLVLIDGLGQGFFPAAGKAEEYREDKGLTVAAGDASDPYHWMIWSHNHTGAPFLKGYQFEPDTNPGVIAKGAQDFPDYPERPWEAPNAYLYPYRAVWNPVQKAFRTIALRRAGHPYVLILDDIRKDDQSRTYDWLMQVADDLEVKSGKGGDIVLGSIDAGDNRRLLVRMLGFGSQTPGSWQLENYEVKRSPISGDNQSYGMGKRLKFECRAVEPKFKVLIYPYREGDSALPGTALDSAMLRVAWPDQKDVYSLSILPNGRTELHLAGTQAPPTDLQASAQSRQAGWQ